MKGTLLVLGLLALGLLVSRHSVSSSPVETGAEARPRIDCDRERVLRVRFSDARTACFAAVAGARTAASAARSRPLRFSSNPERR
jgi:hypothetical protein